MPVNTGLADVSNALLFSTVILYAIGMLCYACDFAFARQRVMAEMPARVAVGAGGPPVTVPAAPPAAGPATAGPSFPQENTPDGAAQRWPVGFWQRTAFGLTCVGLLSQVFAILTRKG